MRSSKYKYDNKHNLTIHEQSLQIVTIMNIYKVDEHLDMQVNKLTKYHLHVQHLTDALTLKHEALGLNCIKDMRSNKGTRVEY